MHDLFSKKHIIIHIEIIVKEKKSNHLVIKLGKKYNFKSF